MKTKYKTIPIILGLLVALNSCKNTIELPKFDWSVGDGVELDVRIDESSGLSLIDNSLWTINDGGDESNLYQINKDTGKVERTVRVENADNRDWEELASDKNNVYIGDFGNNKGERTDLKIYKMSKAELSGSKGYADVIEFSYPEQDSFIEDRDTKFDCEAMVVINDIIYIFTKNHKTETTTDLYKLTTTPGIQVAEYVSTFDVGMLVSGADISPDGKTLSLIGYSKYLNPMVVLFSKDKDGEFQDFKHITFQKTPIAQIEGVSFETNNRLLISSEHFKYSVYELKQMMYTLDF